MGHLAIVNEKTLNNVKMEGYISTRGTLKKQVVKTISDIFSDILATRKGDLIFPWIVKKPKGKNKILGFKYIFKVAGPPIYVVGDFFPIKVPIEPVGKEFDRPLKEEEALDLWGKKLLWNAIGKKSLGRGRSLTHQLPMEDLRLETLLNEANPTGSKSINIGKKNFKGDEISINPSQGSKNPVKDRMFSRFNEEEKKISHLILSGIPWRKDDLFSYEKTLEAWIMENIDSERGESIRNNILEPDLPIEWFGNYLTFGVSGSNIDIVVIQSQEDKKIITVIELKNTPLSQKEYELAARQNSAYGSFIKNAFIAYGYGEKAEIKHVVLCHTPKKKTKYSLFSMNNHDSFLFGYEINARGEVEIKRLV